MSIKPNDAVSDIDLSIYSDCYKDWCGSRPRSNFPKTVAEFSQMMDQLQAMIRDEQLADIEYAHECALEDQLAAELAPNRYEILAIRAGFEA